MITKDDEENFLAFCDIVYQLRDSFKFSVTSWFRTPNRNASVGGKVTSKHLDGLAVDAVLDSPEDMARFKVMINQYHLHWLDEGDHLHIQAGKGE